MASQRNAATPGARGAMTLEEWIAETEAERPERALWPSETDARRFGDVWCTGRERLESNAWNDEDGVAYWWLMKSNGSTVQQARCASTRGLQAGGFRSRSRPRAHDLVDAVALGPARRDLLDAGTGADAAHAARSVFTSAAMAKSGLRALDWYTAIEDNDV